MNAIWKKRLTAWLGLIAAMVLIVEFNKYMRRQTPVCEDGQCAPPDGYGLIINPFPDETLPRDAETNQLTEGTHYE